MTRNAQGYINNNFINKEKIYSLNLSNQELEGEMNLEKFTNLTSINADKNKFTDLNWLSTLPNKNQLKWLSLWGNEIKSVDFSLLLSEFPNLKMLNLDNNPLSGSNLEQLDNQKFFQLVKLVEEKKVKINSWKGTFLTDLLKHTKQLKEENDRLNQQLQAQIQILPK